VGAGGFSSLDVDQLSAEPICDLDQNLAVVPRRHGRKNYYYLKKRELPVYREALLSRELFLG
jgi:hypothetical protein